jgi:predicted HicB family RNase H-like nuclease
MSQRERLSKIMARPSTATEPAVNSPAKSGSKAKANKPAKPVEKVTAKKVPPPVFERDVQMNVKVPESVRQRARLAAMSQNTTIEKIVTRLLREWLNKVGK